MLREYHLACNPNCNLPSLRGSARRASLSFTNRGDVGLSAERFQVLGQVVAAEIAALGLLPTRFYC